MAKLTRNYRGLIPTVVSFWRQRTTGSRSLDAQAAYVDEERDSAIIRAAKWLISTNPWRINVFRRHEPRYTFAGAARLLAQLLDTHFPPAKADDDAAT
ncbi:MAG: hypothetical protein HY461_00515 [Parcubacteria group bacterium]|nr:hypothetical protein [Parcubacteria group bacterium]